MPTPNVLIISGVQGDTRRYRAFHLFEQLRIVGIPANLAHVTERDLLRKMLWADVVILQRVTWDSGVDKLVEIAKSKNKLLISDVDDLIFQPDAFQWIDSPDFQDTTRQKLYRENMQRNLFTLQHSDAVICSTAYLVDQVKQIPLPVLAWVHKNGFSQEMYVCAEEALKQKQPADRSRVVIGYASGTPTHDSDFALVKPVLIDILDRYPKAELLLVGPLNVGAGWGSFSTRVKQANFVPWRTFPRLLAQFDVNLAPLRMGNSFSQSKSEIKYMEAALVRVPTVASATRAFCEAIRDGQNGYLATDKGQWENALTGLVEHEELRKGIGDNAHRAVLQEYAPQIRAKQFVHILEEIFSQVKGTGIGLDVNELPVSFETPKSFWVTAAIEAHPTLVQRGLYSLRVRGISTLVKEIWIFFRRLVSPIFPFSKKGGMTDSHGR